MYFILENIGISYTNNRHFPDRLIGHQFTSQNKCGVGCREWVLNFKVKQVSNNNSPMQNKI